jgi:hypothetical protein
VYAPPLVIRLQGGRAIGMAVSPGTPDVQKALLTPPSQSGLLADPVAAARGKVTAPGSPSTWPSISTV